MTAFFSECKLGENKAKSLKTDSMPDTVLGAPQTPPLSLTAPCWGQWESFPRWGSCTSEDMKGRAPLSSGQGSRKNTASGNAMRRRRGFMNLTYIFQHMRKSCKSDHFIHNQNEKQPNLGSTRFMSKTVYLYHTSWPASQLYPIWNLCFSLIIFLSLL